MWLFSLISYPTWQSAKHIAPVCGRLSDCSRSRESELLDCAQGYVFCGFAKWQKVRSWGFLTMKCRSCLCLTDVLQTVFLNPYNININTQTSNGDFKYFFPPRRSWWRMADSFITTSSAGTPSVVFRRTVGMSRITYTMGLTKSGFRTNLRKHGGREDALFQFYSDWIEIWK